MKTVFSSARRLALAGVAALTLLAQCSLREQVGEGPAGVPPPQFQLTRIDEVQLGGVDTKPLRVPADLGLEARSQIIRGYSSGNLPLHMRLTLAVRDPSQLGHTLRSVNYDVFLDEKLLGKVQAAPALLLPADGAPVQLPLTFDLNTCKFLGDAESALPALRNFAVGLADRRRRPMRLSLRMHPVAVTADGQATTYSNGLPVQMDSVATLTQAPPRAAGLTAVAH